MRKRTFKNLLIKKKIKPRFLGVFCITNIFLILRILNRGNFTVFIIAAFSCCCVHTFAYNVSNNPKTPYEVNDVNFIFKKTESLNKSVLLDAMFLPKVKVYHPDDLENDRGRIKKLYFDNGFFDAVIDTATHFNIADNTVDIDIIIIENSHYTIDKYEITGLEELPTILKQQVYIDDSPVQPGKFYSKDNTTAEINRILELLQNNGYLKAGLDSAQGAIIAKYNNTMQKEPKYKDKVVIKLDFDGVDKVYYFGSNRVSIPDNKYNLGSDIVQREIKFKDGDLFSKKVLVESERNLGNLPIIQLGRIQIDTLIEGSSRVNTVVNILLNNKYQVTPSISTELIDNVFFAGAAVQYDDRNFLGGGRVFSIKLEGLVHSVPINRVSLTASLFLPFLFKSNITANFGAGLEFFNYSDSLQYVRSRNLARFNYYIADYTFYNNLYFDLNADLNRLNFKKHYTDIAHNDTVYNAGSTSNLLNSIVGITVEHSNTNNAFDPSKGFYHSITLEHAGILPKLITLFSKNIQYSQYFKFYIPNKFYFDISGGSAVSIFATSFKIGDIIEYGSGDNIQPVLPIYKFFSGGGSSVRGWRAQTNGILKNPSLGGTFIFEGSFELRRRHFQGYNSFVKNIGAVYFLDYGNVWEKAKYFRLSQVALAVGFGVRYFTFIGPIRIDVGFRLFDPSADDGNKWLWNHPESILKTKYAIQFGLGQAF